MAPRFTIPRDVRLPDQSAEEVRRSHARAIAELQAAVAGLQTAAASGGSGAAITVTTTAPLTIDGAASAALSANRTLAVTAFGSSNSGIVSASGGGTTNFLRADGSWASTPIFKIYGDGFDGAATMDGSTAVNGCTLSGSAYTATRVCMFTTLTINSGVTLKTDGYPIYCSVELANGGTVDGSGGDGVPGASGSGPGLAAWISSNRLLPGGSDGGSQGNNGGNSAVAPVAFTTAGGTAGSTTPPGLSDGGAGGLGAGGGGGGAQTFAGGRGGNLTLVPAVSGDFRQYQCAVNARILSGSSQYTAGTGGGGGGFGTGSNFGGGGGGSGGWIVLAALKFSGSGVIQAKGGNGAAGRTAAVGSNLSGGGGGGGGAGGVVVIACGSGTPPTPVVTGGSGALGGVGDGTGSTGKNGAAGGNGYVVQL